MKICIITGTFRPGASGPSTYLYNLCNSLIGKGHKVGIITYGKLREESELLKGKEEKDKYPFPIKRISRSYPLPLRLFIFFYNIILIGRHYDLLYVNDYGLPAAFANFFLRKPMVMKIVGDFAWEYSIRHGLIESNQDIDEFQENNFGFKVWFFKKLQRFYVRRAKKIITPSRYLKNIINGWGFPEQKIEVIYNAVDVQRYVLKYSKEEARKHLNLDPKAKIILTVARLAPWKGADKVIRLLPEILKEIPQVKYSVIGEGDRSNLDKLVKSYGIKDRVIFTGRIAYSEIPYWFKSADVLVLYSGYEGFSHVILEAMAVGLPIIASKKGGNPEAIDDGINGLLIPISKEEELKKAIIKVLTNQEVAQKLVREGKKKIQKFNWDNLIKQTFEVFKSVL
jgi:glycosyltransferase involved in cell wall biosynthesis